MPIRINQIDSDWVVEKYVSEGLSALRIAEHFGCSKYTIYRRLRESGIKVRKRTNQNPLLNDKKWLIDEYKHKSIRQIALENHLTVGNIHSILTVLGIKTRNIQDSLNLRFPEGRLRELSSNWRGGLTKLAHRIRTCSRYLKWRLKILKRDKYTCIICRRPGNHVDHIKQLGQILFENKITNRQQADKCKILWSTRNGRTMCRKCHFALDTHANREWLRG